LGSSETSPHSFPRPLSAGGKCSLGFAKTIFLGILIWQNRVYRIGTRIPSVSPLEKPDLARHHHTKKRKWKSWQIKTECVVARRGRSGTAEAEADCRIRQSGGAEAVP